MNGYWFRRRAPLSILFSVAIAAIVVYLFVFPVVAQIAADYNSQSVYKNTCTDFIAPEPSFEQIYDLPSTNGIEKVFPFFLTKTVVSVNGNSRTTTVLLSDQFENIGITMYNSDRLIKNSNTDYDNSILVDWQFCKDTNAGIGDIVSFSIGDTLVEYKISAIYETNSIYDGGAILAKLSADQKETIVQRSKNNGYSGMYVKASDYSACQAYLTQEYRPLGRLKAREQFESDEQYNIHYDAIMSSGYANEITDFRIRENSLEKKMNPILVWIGTALTAVLVIAFNIVLSKRGCEKGYFSKHCIPKGQDVKPYYSKSFVCELFCLLAAFVGVILFSYYTSDDYLPKSAFDIRIASVPAAMIVSELICLIMNKTMVNGLIKEEKRKKESSSKG